MLVLLGVECGPISPFKRQCSHLKMVCFSYFPDNPSNDSFMPRQVHLLESQSFISCSNTGTINLAKYSQFLYSSCVLLSLLRVRIWTDCKILMRVCLVNVQFSRLLAVSVGRRYFLYFLPRLAFSRKNIMRT